MSIARAPLERLEVAEALLEILRAELRAMSWRERALLRLELALLERLAAIAAR